MKRFAVILMLGLLSQVSAFSQGVIDFNINFGANPPPHTPGIPDSGAALTNDQFSAILYLDDTSPTSGAIGDFVDGIFTPIFQFTNLVYASYPGGGPAFDYEGTWQLTGNQEQDLLAGDWYAEVAYNDTTYTGQIEATPEPSSLALLVCGLIACLKHFGGGEASKRAGGRTLNSSVAGSIEGCRSK